MPGFPIRTSSDQRLVGNSPRLNAASHVLHRLSMPRHPPYALDHKRNTHTKEQTKNRKTEKQTHTQTPTHKASIQMHDARVHSPVLTHHTHTPTHHPNQVTHQHEAVRNTHKPCCPRHPTACQHIQTLVENDYCAIPRYCVPHHLLVWGMHPPGFFLKNN